MIFTLRGNRFELSRADVEKATTNLQPKQSEKYVIHIGGKSYPPKQLIAESLQLATVSFTTMDACRILQKLGFEIALSAPATPKGDMTAINIRMDALERTLNELMERMDLKKRIEKIEQALQKGEK